MPVNVSNLKRFPPFTLKIHPRVYWVIGIIFQLQRTIIENARINKIDTINTINMINIIYRINQYEDNRYNQSDQWTL